MAKFELQEKIMGETQPYQWKCPSEPACGKIELDASDFFRAKAIFASFPRPTQFLSCSRPADYKTGWGKSICRVNQMGELAEYHLDI